jgi:integrase
MPRGAAVIPYNGKRGKVWRIKYRDATGKQVMETVGAERDGVTEKRAEAELRERLVRVERKNYRRPKQVTFAAYARQWFDVGPQRRRWKPQTVRAYVFVERRLVASFGPMPIGAIRPRHIADFVAGHKLSPSSVGRDLAVLHAIFDSAVREELIDSNPTSRAERPRLPKNRWRLLEPHEVRAVSAAFTDARARLVFRTLTLTGLRRGELLRLRWGDVNLLEATLRVVEAKSEEGERLIALPSTLVRELEAHYAATHYRADSDFVFAQPESGTRLEITKWYPKQFRAALTAAGITDYVRPFHDQRHNALTNMAKAGSSPVAIMATAGHRSFATTKHYLHLAGQTFQDDAAALERRMLGVETSTHLTSPEPISPDLTRSETAQPRRI